jgi:predicted MPP superfamily phosphohydrolase
MKKHQIAIFLFIVQGILFLGHYFVYNIFTLVFGLTSPQSLFLTRVLFFIMSVSFLFATLTNYKFYDFFGRLLYRTAAIFLGTFYWLFFAALLSGALYILNLSLAPVLSQILMFSALLVSLYGVINSHNTRITPINIKIPNLPSAWKNKKAILVADTHFGSYWNINFAKKIVRLIQKQNPDIVFFSGDFFDGPPAYFDRLAKPFAELKIKNGVWFAPGNHEEFSDPKPFFDALNKAGIKVLNNELVEIEGVQIIGVGFGAAHRAEQEQGVLKNLKINTLKASILIKHEPSHIEVASAFNISLQLSGHTHLGQVWPLNYVTKKVYGKFHTGLNSLNKTQVYTTTGAGVWGPPQRVGTKPEIVVIIFE